MNLDLPFNTRALHAELKIQKEFCMKKTEKANTPMAAYKFVLFPNIGSLLKILSARPVTTST
jgi:hypothetical protein